LVVIGLLVVAAVAWFQPWRAADPPPVVPAPAPVAGSPAAPAPGAPATPPPVAPGTPADATPVRIASRADLAALLAARGLDPDRALADLAAWRERLGFLGPDELTGVTAADARSLYYANLDDATLRGLAGSGDVAAVQTLASRNLPANAGAAIDGYADAAAAGSAAAMLAASEVLRSLAQLPADGVGIEPKLAAELLRLRRGDATRDLRADALAWTLAAVRQYGPGAIDQGTLRWIEVQSEQLAPETVATACGQSLALFADLNARGAPREPLPAAFYSEANVYGRLPCQDSAAPVAPPAELARCGETRTRNQFGQDFAVWTCPTN
jgi:hypothetical protein